MERFIGGDIVIVPFPFTDLTDSKRRPSLIIKVLESDDVILCPISSQKKKDKYAISINENDFEYGVLKQKSIIRANCIFTADKKLILYKVGKLNTSKLQVVIDRIIALLKS